MTQETRSSLIDVSENQRASELNHSETLDRLCKRRSPRKQVVQYKDAYRLCYTRGPEGILIGIAKDSADRLETIPNDPKSELLNIFRINRVR